MRLFIALDLPEEVRVRLAMLSGGLPGARWVSPENLHISLRFIGEVSKHEAADIDDALSLLNGKGFPLTLAGIGTFTEGRQVKSLWVGVEGNEALHRLQGKVEQAVQRAGLPPEKRKFKPHVTLARFRSSPPESRMQQYLETNALFRIGPFPVEDYVLFSSFLSQNGALYAQEAVYPLEPLSVA